MDGCDAMKNDPISKDQLADDLSALLGAATLNLDPTISVDLGMAQRLVDILRQSASGEPSEEQVEAARKELPIDGDLLGVWDGAIKRALQAAGIQSRQAGGDIGEVIAGLERLSKRWPEQVLPRAIALLRLQAEMEAELTVSDETLSPDDQATIDRGWEKHAAAKPHQSPTDDAIRSAVKLNSTPDRHCTVFKGTEITGYTLTDEGIAELRKLFGGAPVAVTEEMVVKAILTYHAYDGDWWKVLTEALSLRGVPEGWQPIETAPKDMTVIVGLDEDENVHVTWYFAPSSQTYDWLRNRKSGHSLYWKPKWWVPLHPDTPSAKSDAARRAAPQPVSA
jgi:hypothetical protein